MIVIDGLFKFNICFEVKWIFVIIMGVVDLIKYIWLLEIWILNELDLYKDKFLFVVLII